MTITQLLIDTAIIAGVLLMAVLAIAPLWLEHEAEIQDKVTEPTPLRPTPIRPSAPTAPAVRHAA